MIADDRGSRIADRRSQKVLRSSAIIWKHTSAIACDPAIVIADDRRRSQKIEPCSIFCDRLRSSAIICDRLRSCDHMETGQSLITYAIVIFHAVCSLQSAFCTDRYGNQSSAICDRNVSHNIFNSDR